VHRLLLFFGATVILLACTGPEKPDAQDDFPDLDSIVLTQNQWTADIIKKVWLGGQSDGLVNHQPADWNNQLSFLQRLDAMKKPVYRKSYVQFTRKDSLSNLWVRTWESSDSAAPVRQLSIFFYQQPSRPVKLIARIQEKNILFSKKENFSIFFDAFQPRIDFFRIEGLQKVIWMDPKRYVVEVKVRYK
jgi:hypothetical protein